MKIPTRLRRDNPSRSVHSDRQVKIKSRSAQSQLAGADRQAKVKSKGSGADRRPK